jgi:hypothetical protein
MGNRNGWMGGIPSAALAAVLLAGVARGEPSEAPVAPPSAAATDDASAAPTPQVEREIKEIQRALGGSVVNGFPSLAPSPTFDPPAPSDYPQAPSLRSPSPPPNYPQPPRAESPAPGPRPSQAATLRSAAAALDAAANRLEEAELYEQADALRSQAQQLRVDARQLVREARESGGGSAPLWPTPSWPVESTPPGPRRFGLEPAAEPPLPERAPETLPPSRVEPRVALPDEPAADRG